TSQAGAGTPGAAVGRALPFLVAGPSAGRAGQFSPRPADAAASRPGSPSGSAAAGDARGRTTIGARVGRPGQQRTARFAAQDGGADAGAESSSRADDSRPAGPASRAASRQLDSASAKCHAPGPGTGSAEQPGSVATGAGAGRPVSGSGCPASRTGRAA